MDQPNASSEKRKADANLQSAATAKKRQRSLASFQRLIELDSEVTRKRSSPRVIADPDAKVTNATDNVDTRSGLPPEFTLQQPRRHKSDSTRLPGRTVSQSSAHAGRCPYGNYPNYYGYRDDTFLSNPDHLDHRLRRLPADLFHGRRVLDIGCNAGFVTTSIALHGAPRWVVGVDIDPQLVRKAKQHLSFVYSLQRPVSDPGRSSTSAAANTALPADATPYFPISMPLLFGHLPVYHYARIPAAVSEAVALPGLASTPPHPEVELPFPQNTFFYVGDFVNSPLPEIPATVDVVMALSVTKWIHLHNGDDGLRRFFAKVYHHLSPGGRFILEPQDWSGYAKRSYINDHMRATYLAIKFKPDSFTDYLLTTVGFRSVEQVRPSSETVAGTPAKGFDRPLLMFTR
ncbi:hypothetical protein IWQ60_006132 [Tieghemiomyces parasiticus]|uniref:RNA methyltransferase n=1 Tax=Tieghemiomyces parasiticus TaxID=78921 RepID=A0A9W8DY95_9FUNG|nr:hypothetical protein IWQ60_006132 [Tieghemiomyces parasiticus]